jgi:hypothetical protein
MRLSFTLSFALIVALSLASQAASANSCQTPKMVCSTTMPLGGFCECRAHGTTQDGTVVQKPAPRHKSAAPVGCGTQANQPGCK